MILKIETKNMAAFNALVFQNLTCQEPARVCGFVYQLLPLYGTAV